MLATRFSSLQRHRHDPSIYLRNLNKYSNNLPSTCIEPLTAILETASSPRRIRTLIQRKLTPEMGRTTTIQGKDPYRSRHDLIYVDWNIGQGLAGGTSQSRPREPKGSLSERGATFSYAFPNSAPERDSCGVERFAHGRVYIDHGMISLYQMKRPAGCNTPSN